MNPQTKKGKQISRGKNKNKSVLCYITENILKTARKKKQDIPQRNDNQPEDRFSHEYHHHQKTIPSTCRQEKKYKLRILYSVKLSLKNSFFQTYIQEFARHRFLLMT